MSIQKKKKEPETDTAFLKKSKRTWHCNKESKELPDILKSFYYFIFDLNTAKLTSQKELLTLACLTFSLSY